MPTNYFKPRAGRYGVVPLMARVGAIGTQSLTANGTTTFYVPCGSSHKQRFARMTAQCSTVCTDADGTVTAIVSKVSSGGTTSTALTSALSLEGLTAKVAAAATTLSTLTEASRLLLAGDILKVEVVNNSAAIDTQPVDLYFNIELEAQD